MIKCKHSGSGCTKLIPNPDLIKEGDDGKRHECGGCRNKLYRQRKKEAELAAQEKRGDAEELALLKLTHLELQRSSRDEIEHLRQKNVKVEEELSTLRLEHAALVRSYRILSESALSRVDSWNSGRSDDLESSFSSLAVSPHNPRAPKSRKCKVCRKLEQRPPGSCGKQVKNPCTCATPEF